MISPVGLGDRAVFAQRYDQAGNALGAPVQVNDEPVGIAWPRVVADMQGSFLMAWRQSAPNTALGDITFRRLDAAGMLGTPVRVNPEEFAAAESAPAIAADRSGGFVIAGWYFSTGAIGLFASRYDSAGETPGPAALTDAWLWFGGSAPVLATDPYGGFAIVFSLQEYPASEAPPGSTVYARRYDAAGAPLGAYVRVNPWIYGRTTYAFAPAAAADSYGVLTVVWSDDVGDIRARRYFMPPAPNAETCTGDCDFNNVVTIDELVTGVRMSLDAEARGLGCCQAFDASMDSQVTVDEIVNAVRHALRGCPEN